MARPLLGLLRRIGWLALLWPFAAQPVAAEPILLGERLTLHSDVLDEDRTVLVATPDGYNEGSERYPVIVVLDGMDMFRQTTGFLQALADSERMPPALVVSIENTVRSRDLTPASSAVDDRANVPNHGGASDFAEFIGDELMPWLEAHYRAQPYRVIVGHSYGGLFAVDTLVARPGMFQGIVAVSPSLQWDDEHLAERVAAFLGSRNTLEVSVYLSSSDEIPEMHSGLAKVTAALQSKVPAGMQWLFQPMPTETHSSVRMRSIYNGLEFIFADWARIDDAALYNAGGLPAVEQAYKARYRYAVAPAKALQTVVTAMVGAGRFAEAFDLVRERREILRPPVNVLGILATRLQAAGDPERATAAYRMILDIQPDNAIARQALGEPAR